MSKKLRKASSRAAVSDVQRFIDLPLEEKERIWQDLESKTSEQLMAESRPLNREERARLARFKKLR